MLNPKISYFRVFYSAITKKNCPKLPKTLKLRINFHSVKQVKYKNCPKLPKTVKFSEILPKIAQNHFCKIFFRTYLSTKNTIAQNCPKL